MVFFNYSTMQMVAKIVYYGPGLCGKTTNLNHIYEKTSPKSRGEMVSLATETDRTLFFDLLPLDVGLVGGFKTKFQLYTVPGQVFYNMTRKLVLKGVDGIVFVADSQTPMLDANIESFENLKDNLEDLGLDFDSIPMVFQFNKRDLPNIVPVQKMNTVLNTINKSYVEASALNGDGVFETLKEISRQTLIKLKTKVIGDELKQSKASVEFKVQGSKIKKQIEEAGGDVNDSDRALEKTVVGEGERPAPIPVEESLPGLNAPVPENVSFEDYEAPITEDEPDLDQSLSSINFDMIELDEFEDEIDKLDQPASVELDDAETLDEIDFDEEEPAKEIPTSNDPLKSLDSIASKTLTSSSGTGVVKTQSVDALLGDLVSGVSSKKKKKGDRFQVKVPHFSQAQVNCIFLDEAGNVVHSKLYKVTPVDSENGREIRVTLEIEEA
ncbi:MAG: hypothetical protein KDC35_11135 [Acidobacteria bacterium]|nr:hypothetical protein [Acidobacteriota bacterium]